MAKQYRAEKRNELRKNGLLSHERRNEERPKNPKAPTPRAKGNTYPYNSKKRGAKVP